MWYFFTTITYEWVSTYPLHQGTQNLCTTKIDVLISLQSVQFHTLHLGGLPQQLYSFVGTNQFQCSQYKNITITFTPTMAFHNTSKAGICIKSLFTGWLAPISAIKYSYSNLFLWTLHHVLCTLRLCNTRQPYNLCSHKINYPYLPMNPKPTIPILLFAIVLSRLGS